MTIALFVSHTQENPFRSSLSGQSKDTGGVLLGKMFHEVKNKPLVRVVFDLYCRKDTHHMDVKALHMMCYDFGVYYSTTQIKSDVRKYATDGITLCYEDFMVWWRQNERFR